MIKSYETHLGKMMNWAIEINNRTNGHPNSDTVAAVSLLWLKSFSFLAAVNDRVKHVVWSDNVLEKKTLVKWFKTSIKHPDSSVIALSC